MASATQVEADVCLVLEGTYPYVMGGVSAWVHQIILGLPETTFHLLFIGANESSFAGDPVYDVPENVVGVTHFALHASPGKQRVAANVLEAWAQLLPQLMDPVLGRGWRSFEDALRTRVNAALPAASASEILRHPLAWEHMLRIYESEAAGEPFANFYWTVVGSLTPVLGLMGIELPRAATYHTISTGYAGIVAARAKLEMGAQMLVTEHGIYTKERRIDIGQADWILEPAQTRELSDPKPPYFRRWWVRMFEGLSQVAYQSADELLTIHHGNTALQIKDGADPGKLRVIPNGVDASRIAAAADAAPERSVQEPFTVGFVGRVAPIKDIETLLGAMALLRRDVPDARLRIMGPITEDAEYVERCRGHLARLGLTGAADFEGPVNVAEELPRIDALVLTSISEAQPLVLLEGGAAGVPVVATDVGACRELVFGRTLPDRELGAGGLITPIGSPRTTADALLTLFKDPELRTRMGLAGRERVQRFYTKTAMMDAYRSTYQNMQERAQSA